MSDNMIEMWESELALLITSAIDEALKDAADDIDKQLWGPRMADAYIGGIEDAARVVRSKITGGIVDAEV